MGSVPLWKAQGWRSWGWSCTVCCSQPSQLGRTNRKDILMLLKREECSGLQNLIVQFRCQASLSLWKEGTYRLCLPYNRLLSNYNVDLGALFTSSSSRGSLSAKLSRGVRHSHDRCFYFTCRLLWKDLGMNKFLACQLNLKGIPSCRKPFLWLLKFLHLFHNQSLPSASKNFLFWEVTNWLTPTSACWKLDAVPVKILQVDTR